MILDNLKSVLKRIEVAADKAGRDPGGVEVVAVVKKAALDDIRRLLDSGTVRHIGENRIQSAEKRREYLGPAGAKALWRFIGHLQTNKARRALDLFDWIDTVDSLRLAEALDRHLGERGRRMKVLVQARLADKDTQSGIPLGSVPEFLGELRRFTRLEPAGIMAIGPMLDPVERVRPFFRAAREVFERHFPEPGREGSYLSMGMSRDFEVAVEEGANLLRIGTALFEQGPGIDTTDNSTTMEGSNDR